MTGLKDLTGEFFGRWTVLSRADNSSNGSARWNVICSCGVNRAVLGFTLRNGGSASCGCLNRENLKKVHKDNTYGVTHGLVDTPIYNSWANMKRRCNYDPSYKGRVTYHPAWEVFVTFYADMRDSFEAFMQANPGAKITLDRVSNAGHYTPDNCQWLIDKDNYRKNRRGV